MTALECLVPQAVKLISAGCDFQIDRAELEFVGWQGVRVCSVEGCDGFVVAKGMCDKHYRRSRKFGSPTATPDRYGISFRERMAIRSRETESGCIEWIGTKDHLGYGKFKVEGKSRLVHRVVFELERGPIPRGLCVCHRCDNPSCIRIDHLFLGTVAENAADMRNKRRHCYGERHPGSRLSDAQVYEIRCSSESNRVVARAFGIAKSYVSKLRRKERRGLS